MTHVFQSPALGIDVPAQARQQAPDSTKFPALTPVAVFQNIILHLVDYIALASDDVSQNIGKVLDEVDDEGEGAWDGQTIPKFDPQLVDDFERMEPGCYHETFIDEEVDYAEAIRVSVELEMQVPENPCKAALYSFEADMQIGIEENRPRAGGDSFGRTNPFFGADIGEAEMEPDGFIKPSIRFAGEIPIERFGGPVLVKLKTAD